VIRWENISYVFIYQNEIRMINKVIATISTKTYTIRGLAVMFDSYLVEYGATVANFATVQNQGS